MDWIEIAKAGASVTLDGSKFSKLDLIAVAKKITDGCNLQVTNTEALSKLDLVEIAKAAPGKVIF